MRRWIAVGCFLIGSLILWRTFGARPPAPAAVVLPIIVATAPEAMEAPSPSPTATPVPTIEPATRTPFPTAPPMAGVAPISEQDCPADHLVKGNIVDRNPNKGDRIYHLIGSASYKATKPERCFVDAVEAEQAGYRAIR